MATKDGMLEWRVEADGSRKAFIGLGNAIGWIEVAEVKRPDGEPTGTFRTLVTFALQSGGGPGAVDKIGADFEPPSVSHLPCGP